jgi:hypothetical protein
VAPAVEIGERMLEVPAGQELYAPAGPAARARLPRGLLLVGVG